METEMAENGTKKTFYVVNKHPESAQHAFKNFLYNPDTGAVCGRTPMSWAKITVFYLIFFTCLGLFALAMFGLFWKFTIEEDRPRWTLQDSLIGTNPGIGFRPMPDQDKNAESTLIWINTVKDSEESYWANELEKFLKSYNKTGKACSYENSVSADDTTACDFDLTKLGSCQPGSGFGYTGAEAGKPCVLIKLNKIFGWKPESFLDDSLPDDMPIKLQKKIKGLKGSSEVNSIWITCNGENPADREYVGPIEYLTPGLPTEEFGQIPNYYFPYFKQPNFESPFVFVRFPNPMKRVLIQIECRAWAKNIKYDRFFRSGSTHFELMIDGPDATS